MSETLSKDAFVAGAVTRQKLLKAAGIAAGAVIVGIVVVAQFVMREDGTAIWEDPAPTPFRWTDANRWE